MANQLELWTDLQRNLSDALPKSDSAKHNGAFYTPDFVVQSLVQWAVREATDRMLDPACGDGRFLQAYAGSVGVEQQPAACRLVESCMPGRLLHQGDFFGWAAGTTERFECAAGNPPFIRYQDFSGALRIRALRLCTRHGATFSSLTSSWAPFLVATATLLKRDGRMAFVVPAELGHAPYAIPVIEYLCSHFRRVHVIAVREKLFPALSEDCWLLSAEGFGESTADIHLSVLERFQFLPHPPVNAIRIPLSEWRAWNCRLRPFLLRSEIRDLYRANATSRNAVRLTNVARVGIGYVSGANDFFHLKPSEAEHLGIPMQSLTPAVRGGRALAGGAVTLESVQDWRDRDERAFSCI